MYLLQEALCFMIEGLMNRGHRSQIQWQLKKSISSPKQINKGISNFYKERNSFSILKEN